MDTSDDHLSTNHQKSETLELLEIERREIIGEILKLNPSYKVPHDYKPLLKEDKVVIPIKEYPERNFIGVIFAGDTLKRWEKESGAKLRVYGTKADTKKEVEITSSDGNECDYEELSVHVTAETYDKVDAAVSLIDLLISPVSANTVPDPTEVLEVPVSEDNSTTVNATQDPPPPFTISPVNQTPPLPRFPNQWHSSTPQFPNMSISTPPFPNLSVSAPIPSPSQPHRPLQVPNMGYAGPPRNPLPPVQGVPRQPNFSSPNMRPMGSPMTSGGWSQPPPPPVRSVPALRPQQPPSSNDFTFQTHHRPQPPSSQFMPPPQPPSFRPGPPPMMQQPAFHRPQNSHQMGGPSSMPPVRRPVFSGHGPPPPPQAARQFGSPASFLPPRGGNFGQVIQNHHPSMGFGNQNFLPTNQQLRGNVNVGYSLGVPRQQIYDPFAPSGESRGNPENLRKQESDPEYDDLMASVGVK